MAASKAPQKITVRLAVARVVTTHNIALRVDSVAFGRSRAGNVNGDEIAVTLNEPVLISALIVVETDKVSFRVYARDPGERGVGKVDGCELPIQERKAMKRTVAVEIGAHNFS